MFKNAPLQLAVFEMGITVACGQRIDDAEVDYNLGLILPYFGMIICWNEKSDGFYQK